MPRNLDLTALRSFIAVADLGGVTKAAGMLNLTQSAVSMQLKRLEEALDCALLDRSGRSIALTASGEQLLRQGRRMIALNDEIIARMSSKAHEGTLTLGVPHDIVYPSIPQVLQLFSGDYPRVKVQLVSSLTLRLKELFADGKCDIILATEDRTQTEGEILVEKDLRWYGAPGGTAWQRRPLPVASEPNCLFRRTMLDALDSAGISWELAVDSESSRTVEATVSADLAVLVQLSGMATPLLEEVPHGGALPSVGKKRINMYVSQAGRNEARDHLADLVRRAYMKPKLALTA